MPEKYGYCDQCRKRVLLSNISADGICLDCVAHNRKNAETRAANLDRCKDGTASAPVQKLYDAFSAKYSVAHLTGISVKDDGARLLMYLDGAPMYYVTIDPLTDAAQLASYADSVANKDAAADKDAVASAEAKSARVRSRWMGLCGAVSILAIVYVLITLTAASTVLSLIGGYVALACMLLCLVGYFLDDGRYSVFGGVMVFLSIPMSLSVYFILVPIGFVLIACGLGFK